MPANTSLEQSLLKGELKLNKIFSAFTDGVYDYNVKEKITQVNDNFYHLLGYDANEFDVTNEKWDKLIHPDDLKASTDLFEDHIEGKTQRYLSEYRMRRKDGIYQWISCTGRLIERDLKGNPLRVVGAIKSIQSKKQLELGMKLLIDGSSKLKGEVFFKYMIENMANLFQVKHAMIAITEDHKPNDVESFVMWHIDKVINSPSYEIKDSPSELIYTSGEKVIVWEDLIDKFPNDRFIKKNGIVGYYGVPIYSPSNELIGHLCVMNDNEILIRQWMESMIELYAQAIGAEVERINNEEKLYDLNELLNVQVEERTVQLEKAVEDLDSFFYKASHDLRAPITTLEGIYNLLESEIDTEEKVKLFKLLGTQIISIKKLNRSIIEVGNIRNHSYKKESINLSNLIEELLDTLPIPKSVIIEKNIESSLMIKTDIFLLSNILREFLANSIKHRNPKNKNSIVLIESKNESGVLELLIKDNGSGISDKIEHNYFKLFLRASTTSSGFGLGLYRAKLAADKANISIEIKSQVEVGTEIWLRFN